MIASAVSKPIFDMKATEDKTNISTPMFSGSGGNFISFGSLAVAPHQKGLVVSSQIITSQADQEVLGLDHKQGGVSFYTLPKTILIMLVMIY